jgi:hypothetical protein
VLEGFLKTTQRRSDGTPHWGIKASRAISRLSLPVGPAAFVLAVVWEKRRTVRPNQC